jgi:predicted RNA polymerase sigma factor
VTATDLEDVWRREAPHVLAALVHRYGDFHDGEDATQEALLAASEQWPQHGVPTNPRGWLVRVASRRLIDHRRSDSSRQQRELAVATQQPADAFVAAAPDDGLLLEGGDTLELLLLCCHPALTRQSQVALTLRAVGGLLTSQIAAAFLVPEATMGQRISRAKATLRASGAHFLLPDSASLPERLAAVMQVLCLVFNEGYTRSSGTQLLDVSLTDEAIRLTRQLQRTCPDVAEAAGLLALMLLTDARRPARMDANGDLIPLEHQDRSRWDRHAIGEGVAILEKVLPEGAVGPFQLQAAIAAVHDEAPTWADTDWLQIAMLYRMLDRVAPSPTVTLNLAVAVGMAHGAEAGLAVLEPLLERPGLSRHHRVYAVRAHLLEMAGRHGQAAEAYAHAARLAASIPEQRYLNGRAAAAARPDQRPGD